MNENNENITLGAIKIGKLMMVDANGMPMYADNNNEKNEENQELYFWGSVIGPIKNKKLFDIETKISFEILPVDDNGNLILTNMVAYQLYAINIDKIENVLENYHFPYKLKENVNAKRCILKRLMAILKERKLPHITDREHLGKIKNKVPNDYYRIFSFIRMENNVLLMLHDLRNRIVNCTNSFKNSEYSKHSAYNKEEIINENEKVLQKKK